MNQLHLLLLKIFKILPVWIRFKIAYLHSDKFVVGVIAIIKRSDEILLTKNSYQYSWALPGGFLTRGEGFNESITREIKEELGIEVIIERILEISSVKTKPVIDVFILCHYKDGVIAPDKVEIEKAKFFKINKLPAKVLPVHKKYINKYKMV